MLNCLLLMKSISNLFKKYLPKQYLLFVNSRQKQNFVETKKYTLCWSLLWVISQFYFWNHDNRVFLAEFPKKVINILKPLIIIRHVTRWRKIVGPIGRRFDFSRLELSKTIRVLFKCKKGKIKNLILKLNQLLFVPQ